MITCARGRGQLSARHLNDVTARLTRFKEDFAARPVRTVTAREVEQWLYGRDSNTTWAPQTLANWRAVLNAFFVWTQNRHLAQRRELELKGRAGRPF